MDNIKIKYLFLFGNKLREYLLKLFADAAKKLPYLGEIPVIFEIPKQESHGDFSTNAAMLLTKKLRKNPGQIAREIIDNLSIDDRIIHKQRLPVPVL